MTFEGKTRATSDMFKDKELRLIAELMKNSRRSDQELAKGIGGFAACSTKNIAGESYFVRYVLTAFWTACPWSFLLWHSKVILVL